MELDSVRGLKAELLGGAQAAASAVPIENRARRTGAGRVKVAQPRLPKTVALGVSRRSRHDYRLAIRVQERHLLTAPSLEALRKTAKGEVDIRYIGHLAKRPTARVPLQQRRQRPLRIGLSIGHFRITAGTLGAFVKLRNGDIRILSNNHVLADENKGRAGDAILQQGPIDGGRLPADTVARLATFVRLSRSGVNRMDAALAELDAGINYQATELRGHGKLAGAVTDPDAIDGYVEKLGRTTGHTRGRVTAFDVDHVNVSYDIGNLRFDGQIEIEGTGSKAFSDGGDSGSLIYTSKSHLAIGLLFAGSDTGGTNGKGLTYANPIGLVLERLKVLLL